jgi:hypothetical protein
MNETTTIEDTDWFAIYASKFFLAQIFIYFITSYAWNSSGIFETFAPLQGKGSLVLLSVHAGMMLAYSTVQHGVYHSMPCWMYKFISVFFPAMVWCPLMIILVEFCVEFHGLGTSRQLLRMHLTQGSRAFVGIAAVAGIHTVMGLISAFGINDHQNNSEDCELGIELEWFVVFLGVYCSIMVILLAFMEAQIYSKNLYLRMNACSELLVVIIGCRLSVIFSIGVMVAYAVTLDLICISIYCTIPIMCYMIPNFFFVWVKHFRHWMSNQENITPCNRILTIMNPFCSSGAYQVLLTQDLHQNQLEEINLGTMTSTDPSQRNSNNILEMEFCTDTTLLMVFIRRFLSVQKNDYHPLFNSALLLVGYFEGVDNQPPMKWDFVKHNILDPCKPYGFALNDNMQSKSDLSPNADISLHELGWMMRETTNCIFKQLSKENKQREYCSLEFEEVISH